MLHFFKRLMKIHSNPPIPYYGFKAPPLHSLLLLEYMLITRCEQIYNVMFALCVMHYCPSRKESESDIWRFCLALTFDTAYSREGVIIQTASGRNNKHMSTAIYRPCMWYPIEHMLARVLCHRPHVKKWRVAGLVVRQSSCRRKTMWQPNIFTWLIIYQSRGRNWRQPKDNVKYWYYDFSLTETVLKPFHW